MDLLLPNRPLGCLVLALALVLGGCFTEDAADIEIRNGLAYKRGTNTTYSGKIVEYYPSNGTEEKRVFREGSYEMGRRHGKWTTHKWNKAMETAWYEYGKLSGAFTVYYPNGEKKLVKRYENGKLNGASATYGTDGRVIQTTYYENDVQVGPPQEEVGSIRDQLHKAFGMFSGFGSDKPKAAPAKPAKPVDKDVKGPLFKGSW